MAPPWWLGALRLAAVYAALTVALRSVAPAPPRPPEGPVGHATPREARPALPPPATFGVALRLGRRTVGRWAPPLGPDAAVDAAVAVDLRRCLGGGAEGTPMDGREERESGTDGGAVEGCEMTAVFQFGQWKVEKKHVLLRPPKKRRERKHLWGGGPNGKETLATAPEDTVGSEVKEEGSDPNESDEMGDSMILQTKWHLNVVADESMTSVTGLPPQVQPFIVYATEDLWLPIVYDNPFWITKSSEVVVNKTHPIHTVEFSLWTVSLLKFVMYRQFEESMDMQEAMGTSSGARDETRRMLIETDPWLLGLTVCVSMLHLVFEYLAFSNDIQFWRQRRDFKGLSLRAVVMEFYFAVIIFLYLLDGEETSWTVLVPNGIGVAISGWKMRKVVRIDREGGKWSLKFIREDARTMTYDQRATRLLLKILAPLLVCYAIYSSIYHTHKGWYSFLISTQVQFIYMSGFVMMLPQLFINYQLKSVAQLPWRTFVYKALNTVIDDLFAFIVKMPLLHRLACFRDDIVFAILLYQRWIYPVDTRRTEDGQVIDEDTENATGKPTEKLTEKPTEKLKLKES